MRQKSTSRGFCIVRDVNRRPEFWARLNEIDVAPLEGDGTIVESLQVQSGCTIATHPLNPLITGSVITSTRREQPIL